MNSSKSIALSVRDLSVWYEHKASAYSTNHLVIGNDVIGMDLYEMKISVIHG